MYIIYTNVCIGVCLYHTRTYLWLHMHINFNISIRPHAFIMCIHIFPESLIKLLCGNSILDKVPGGTQGLGKYSKDQNCT